MEGDDRIFDIVGSGNQLNSATNDLGIDEATFSAALRVIGHPWRPGQRCHYCEKQRIVGETIGGNDIWAHREHDIPIPAVTDELLMQMLIVGVERRPEFLLNVYDKMWSCDSIDSKHDVSFRAAII